MLKETMGAKPKGAKPKGARPKGARSKGIKVLYQGSRFIITENQKWIKILQFWLACR